LGSVSWAIIKFGLVGYHRRYRDELSSPCFGTFRVIHPID
jgi:hypothetical protein